MVCAGACAYVCVFCTYQLNTYMYTTTLYVNKFDWICCHTIVMYTNKVMFYEKSNNQGDSNKISSFLAFKWKSIKNLRTQLLIQKKIIESWLWLNKLSIFFWFNWNLVFPCFSGVDVIVVVCMPCIASLTFILMVDA